MPKDDCYEALKLENQLCFPLYVCSRQILKLYYPFLKEQDLTYTQYITLLVLWERAHATIHDLCEILHLDTGTLTPLIRKMEANGLVKRSRNLRDERYVHIELTDEGWKLREKVLSVPEQVASKMRIAPADAQALYRILYTMMNTDD
mgnify:FL=1